MRLYITIEQKLYRFFINCICNNKVIEDGLMMTTIIYGNLIIFNR